MASTPASSPMDTLPKQDDASPSTLFTLTVVTVLGLLWFVLIVGLGLAIAAALQWLLAN